MKWWLELRGLRCPERWGGDGPDGQTRCELRVGHDAMHTAPWSGGTLQWGSDEAWQAENRSGRGDR